MKKSKIIALLCSVFLLHNVNAQDLHEQDKSLGTNYVLNGKLGNLQYPAKVYLTYTTADGAWVRDSAMINNGRFMFKQYVLHPVSASISVSRSGKPTQLFRSKDITSVYIEPGAKINLISDEDISNRKIEGSKSELNFRDYANATIHIDKKIDSINRLVNDPANESRKNLLKSNFKEALEMKRSLTKEYILLHPNEFVSLNLLDEYAGYSVSYSDVNPIFQKLSTELKGSLKGEILSQKLSIAKKSGIGVQAIDFTQPDINGKPISLSSYRGKWVLIDFWASWCGPCRAESPVLKNAYEEFKSKNFDILGVSLDFNKNNWIKAIHDDGLTWNHVSDLKYWKNSVAVQYGVASAPQNVLVDPNGKIVAKNLRGDQLRIKLKELLR